MATVREQIQSILALIEQDTTWRSSYLKTKKEAKFAKIFNTELLIQERFYMLNFSEIITREDNIIHIN